MCGFDGMRRVPSYIRQRMLLGIAGPCHFEFKLYMAQLLRKLLPASASMKKQPE